MKNLGLTVSSIILGLIFVPVLINQFKENETRKFQGTSLSETNYEEVKFTNEEQNLSLSGLLLIPKGEGPFPAVVMIHGSGSSKRDNIWYLTLATYLQHNEILVLLPDKRGSDQSEGSWRTSGFGDLASDAIAAVEYLKSQNTYAILNLGVIGLSQGGQIAPIAANKCSDIDFVVNICGAAVPMYEQLLYEETNNLKEIGFLPVISAVLARLTTYYHINIGKNKEFWETIGNFNSIEHWGKIKVNVFVLYGEHDTNTPTKESAQKLKALNKSNIYLKIYNDSGHALEDPIYAGNNIFRNDALADIKEFIISQ